jgi:hypothetical protein
MSVKWKVADAVAKGRDLCGFGAASNRWGLIDKILKLLLKSLRSHPGSGTTARAGWMLGSALIKYPNPRKAYLKPIRELFL